MGKASDAWDVDGEGNDPFWDPKLELAYDDSLYEDQDEPTVNRAKGGAIPNELVVSATVYCKKASGKEKGKELVRCLGSATCKSVWSWPRRKDRILKHLSSCAAVPSKYRQEAAQSQSDKAPLAKIEKRKAEDSVEETTSASKVARIRPTGDVTLSKKSPGLVLDLARDYGRQELKATLDNDIVMLICAAGLPPYIANLPQWRTLLEHATRGAYKPASKDTLRDNHIPATASLVRKKQIAYLQTQENLTGTYDGGTTRRPQSIYTFHVTDSSRRTFLIEGDESSTVSHTGEFISSIHQRVRACSAVHSRYLHVLRLSRR